MSRLLNDVDARCAASGAPASSRLIELSVVAWSESYFGTVGTDVAFDIESSALAQSSPSGSPSLDESDDRFADVVAMSGQAAVDGLPLEVVLDDLRLVLYLPPDADLPADALRRCAVQWAEVSLRQDGRGQ